MPTEIKHTAVIIKSGDLLETTDPKKYQADPSTTLDFAIHYVELEQLEILSDLIQESKLELVLFSYDLLDSMLDWAVQTAPSATSTLSGLEKILPLLTENNIPVYFLYLHATEPQLEQSSKNKAKLLRLKGVLAALRNQEATAKIIGNREAHHHIIRKILSGKL